VDARRQLIPHFHLAAIGIFEKDLRLTGTKFAALEHFAIRIANIKGNVGDLACVSQ
jgi:hypothetical protein